jgi:hypothetical protein
MSWRRPGVDWSDDPWPRQYLSIDDMQYGMIDRAEGKWIGQTAWCGAVVAKSFEAQSAEIVKRNIMRHLLEHHQKVVDLLTAALAEEEG